MASIVSMSWGGWLRSMSGCEHIARLASTVPIDSSLAGRRRFAQVARQRLEATRPALDRLGLLFSWIEYWPGGQSTQFRSTFKSDAL
jgi:hypothetical protein